MMADLMGGQDDDDLAAALLEYKTRKNLNNQLMIEKLLANS